MQAATWWQKSQRRLAPYLFISPFYILFLVFFLGPVLFALYLAFHSWNGIDPMRLVGLGNFGDILSDPAFSKAIRNTAFYCGSSLFIVTPISMLLAVALNAKLLRFKSTFRTIFFTPVVTSSVAVSIVFLLLYSFRSGLLNTLLGGLGIERIHWLESREWSKISVMGLAAWRWAGFNSVYFLAGLQTIPQTLYEAAMVDGANRWEAFWHITIPMLRPVILFVGVMVLIGSAQTFEEPYMLTRGGPLDSSLSLANYLYREGMEYVRLGYASAVGFFMFLMIFLFSWLQMRAFGIFRED